MTANKRDAAGRSYEIIRSNRKTVALYVRKDGAVEIRAPFKESKTEIDKFVRSKSAWIEKRIALFAEMAEKRGVFALNYGDTVIYGGKEYPITARLGNHLGFNGHEFYMPPDLPPEQIKSFCVQIYRMIAKRHSIERVKHFAKIMGLEPSAVKISGATLRWGSCSARKSLNFSWRLFMADEDVIDYVVVHELAHITEMNHSGRFWAIVSGVLPDYMTRREKLKILQKRLNAEDWE